MGEGEHTIIGKIPRERLNQIASRKLSALGIPVRLGADRETLEGELALSRALHPATGQPLSRGRFAVVGHDHLRFLDPPLAALGPVPFHDHERAAQLDQAIAALLQQRAAVLSDVAARLRALRLEAGLDADRLAARAVEDAQPRVRAPRRPGGSASRGSRRSAARPSRSPRSSAARSRRAAHALRARAAPRRRAAHDARAGGEARQAAAPGAGSRPPRRRATRSRSPRCARVFGEEATLAPNAMVELVQEFQHGGTRYRFVASREMGTRFKGRLIGPNGDVWSDRFELAAFPGTREVVALALGVAPPSAEAAPDPRVVADAPARAGEIPGHVQPHPGEVWVMNVVVEEAREGDVRYVGTDIDGRPYGAARVLPRADFEAVFAQERGGWRLLVLVDQLQEGSVIYRQLDRNRQPIGAPRKMAAAILVANFVPEAAAY
jgi:hypothetical protein